ncbi:MULTISPECIES: substrate-binding domain-containing protein [unclassified Lysobacter]|uniref:substrate-binding domain-containing protein n=1 Tax=unclassified Lysobacter TaxID=2635362 RepID=UPI001BE7C742|nr:MULTISPECIES: substrate-binding domain-containing protein [unclassified Lysobacter]MBT2746177.1 substrate-binding domain-containing protein [Lysobacter sp. ISL-42]MBT2753175.1 substrate-binding domain-containing protein [Lysobacter sp. ISL-50]MBT2776889.1 substrate-binding domain-containing protein [Lysobacter sp. ISL-54]MBT2782364.1 substrate-binding domain-containing protein [Lysobacter sp. ISL-52]
MPRAVVSPFLLVFAFVLSAFAAPAAAQDAERVRIRGSNTLAHALVPAVAQSWLRDIGYSGIRVDRSKPALTEIHATRDGQPLIVEIGASDSARGFNDLIEGQTQIAMMTRRPNAAELDAGWQLGDLGTPDQEFVIALDGVAVVVNRNNPVVRLNFNQLRALLSGQSRDWRELGAAGQVHLHLDSSAGAVRDLINERVMRGAAFAEAQQHANARELIAAVAADPLAIGLIPLGEHYGVGTRPLAIADGGRAIAPTRTEVSSEDYPLSRRLYLYGGQMMGALSRSFALYAMTRPGQRAVARSGHVAVTLVPGRERRVTLGPGEYRQLVDNAVRLPLSLRFNFNGPSESGVAASVYDSRAVRDLDRLRAFMQLPPNRGRRLLVIGFADISAGSTMAAMMMSNDRADLIAQELVSRGLKVQQARGMGTALPVAGPRDAAARYRNERVEVWLL